MTRVVRADIDNHGRTTSHFSRKYAKRLVQQASFELMSGGVLGLLDYSAPNQRDPRWTNFMNTVPYDKVDTGNGIYLPEINLLVIHGQEVPTNQGEDVLIVGLPHAVNIPSKSPLEDIIKRADEHKALKIVAAPFHKGGLGKRLLREPYLLQYFDGVETFSGEAAAGLLGRFPHANDRALNFFETHYKNWEHLFEVIGSDGHSITETGQSWQEIPMPSDYIKFRDNPCAVIDALREGYTSAECSARMQDPYTSQKTPAVWGAWNHVGDILTLILAGKVRLNSNKHVAPILEKIGITI